MDSGHLRTVAKHFRDSADQLDTLADFQDGMLAESAILAAPPVKTLKLGTRCRKMCQRNGIETIGQLISMTEDELMGTKNFGLVGLREIKEKLGRHGLKLKSV